MSDQEARSEEIELSQGFKERLHDAGLRVSEASTVRVACTEPLSERDRSLIAYALRTLRSDLERKADSTERKLALADLPESNFGYSEEKRAALVAAVKRNDADVQDINALYARLKLRGTEVERGGRAAAHEATLQRIERRLDAADAAEQP